MGVGTSKYFHLRNEKTLPDSKDYFQSNPSDIKNEVLIQLSSDSCIDANTGKGGVSFYTPLRDDIEDSVTRPGVSSAYKPDLTKRHSDILTDSFTAKERETMADVIKADNLREKGRWAKLSEERRLLALRRRKRHEQETKQKYTQRSREAEERLQLVKERLRPKQSKVHDVYNR